MRVSPLVSVLTTVYNREPFLAACIESVLAQTMDDLELIIVDDCSTDNSYAVAKPYLSDPRIRLYRNDTNLGDYPNRNRAASLATGTYLKYVDADDLIYPHCLELMVEGMETFPDAGYGISKEIPHLMAPALLSPHDAYRSHFFTTGLFSVGPLDAIIRREAFKSVGGFSPERYTSDTDLFLRLGARWPCVVLVPGLVWWRHHEGQESVEEGLSSERILDVALRRHRNADNALINPNCPLTVRETRILRRQAKWQLFRLLLGRMRRADVAGAGRMFREAIKRPPANRTQLIAPATRQALSSKWEDRASQVHSRYKGSKNRSCEGMAATSVPGSAPLFSVLIPLQTNHDALLRAIDSVYAQRFNDWELILLAPGGAAGDQLLKAGCRSRRVRIVQTNGTLGRWHAYNYGAELAHGTYLKFLEPDEALYPHCLDHAARMMRCHAAAALGVSGPCGPFLSGTCLEPLRAIESEFLSTPRLLTGPTGLVCSTAEFREIGGFIASHEPVARNLAIRFASRKPMVLLPDGLVFQRPWRDWYASASSWGLGRAAGFPWLCEYLHSDECPLSALQREGAIANLRQLAAQELIELLRQGHWYTARAVLREMGFGLGDLSRRGATWHRASEEFYGLAQSVTLQSLDTSKFTGSV